MELKDDAKPVCSRPYPVLRVDEEIFKKEVKRLVKLVVLEEKNEYRWGAPSFVQPKAKTSKVRSLSEFRNLNRQLKLKPYPITKINEMILNIEGVK